MNSVGVNVCAVIVTDITGIARENVLRRNEQVGRVLQTFKGKSITNNYTNNCNPVIIFIVLGMTG
jgi:hypothetical protein